MYQRRNQLAEYLILTILLSVFPGLATADGFLDAPVYRTGREPLGVVAADYNGDGYLDLATVNYEDQSVSVLLNNGDGTFAPPLNSPAGLLPEVLVAGDFNGDGNLACAEADFGV